MNRYTSDTHIKNKQTHTHEYLQNNVCMHRRLLFGLKSFVVGPSALFYLLQATRLQLYRDLYEILMACFEFFGGLHCCNGFLNREKGIQNIKKEHHVHIRPSLVGLA